MFAQIAVLESEEIEHAIDADGVKTLLGVGHHAWLSVERYTESASPSMGRSFAPSPTAMVCARFTFPPAQ